MSELSFSVFAWVSVLTSLREDWVRSCARFVCVSLRNIKSNLTTFYSMPTEGKSLKQTLGQPQAKYINIKVSYKANSFLGKKIYIWNLLVFCVTWEIEMVSYNSKSFCACSVLVVTNRIELFKVSKLPEIHFCAKNFDWINTLSIYWIMVCKCNELAGSPTIFFFAKYFENLNF